MILSSRPRNKCYIERQVCLVTGAARGLGNEFCRAFMRSGCASIALLDLKQSEAQTAAEELVEFAGTVSILSSFVKVVFSDPRS